MKSYGKYWETRKKRGDQRTTRSKHFLNPSLLRSALALLTLVAPGATLPPARAAQFGDIETFASVPASPGFPEGISVDGNRVYVSGPARDATAGTGPSKVLVYDRKTGALDSEVIVSGEDLDFEHALSCNAVDGDGRLYVLTDQLF